MPEPRQAEAQGRNGTPEWRWIEPGGTRKHRPTEKGFRAKLEETTGGGSIEGGKSGEVDHDRQRRKENSGLKKRAWAPAARKIGGKRRGLKTNPKREIS